MRSSLLMKKQESNDSIMRNIINRQAPIPTRKSQNVTTVDDYQSSMLLRIFEGERAIAEKNTLLGEIKLLNIRPALTGEVVVEVTFEYHVRLLYY